MGRKKPIETLNEWGLTPREDAFCHEYVRNGCNATRAALEAFTTGNAKTAANIGSDALKRPEISDRIKQISGDSGKKSAMESVEVMTRLANIARLNPKDFFDEQGRLKHIHDLPDAVAECVQSMEIVTKEVLEQGKVVDVQYIHKIKFWDKLKGLELTGKTQALFIERIEEKVTHEFADLDDDAIARIVEGLAAKSTVSALLERIRSTSQHSQDPVDVSGNGAVTS